MQTVIFIFHQMFNFAIPLLIVALGGMFSSLSGITNIGLDGIMIFGALCSVTFIKLTQGILSGQLQLILAILIAVTSGALFSLPHAYASIKLKANQIISGQALNMLAPAFAIFISRILFGEQIIQYKNTFRVDQVPVLSQIPIIGDILFKDAYITTYIGFIILFVSAFVLFRMRFGLHLRACGEYPQAPDSVGINVYKIRYIGVLISGALAGLGGLVYVIPNSTNFNATVSGYGFLALAVMILGNWNPWKICIASFFFGLMKTFSATYSGISFLSAFSLPGNIYKMLPYVITMLVLMFGSKVSNAPKAEGQVFEKGMR